jgi:hypothetical protein
MNEIGLLIGCVFVFFFSALFLIGGPSNAIEGLLGLKEFLTEKTSGGESKPFVVYEFILLLVSVLFFGTLWVSSFFIVPWTLYTMSIQAKPIGLIVSIGLSIWLLLGIGQELWSKYKSSPSRSD